MPEIANEPARRPRTRAASQPEAPPAPPANPQQRAAELLGMDFFDYTAALTPGERDERLIYLYRQDPRITKADGSSLKYITKMSPPLDEEYVKLHFGGGRYLAIVKNQAINQAERKHSFEIDGAPILQGDERLRGAPAAPEPTGAAGQNLDLGASLANRLVTVVQDAMKSNQPQEEAIRQVSAAMNEGLKASIEMMRTGMSEKLSSATGNPMLDRFMEASIKRLENPAAAGGGGMGEAIALLQTLGVLKRKSLMEEIKELIPALDLMGISVKDLLRRGGSETASDWKSEAVKTIPMLFQEMRGMMDSWDQHTRLNYQIAAAQGRAAAQAQNPARNVISMPAPQTRPPAPAAAAPPREEPVEQPMTFDFIKGEIVRLYAGGNSGFAVGLVLKEKYPAIIPQLTQLLTASDEEQIAAFCAQDPVLKQIVLTAGEDGREAQDPDFPEFLHELIEELAGSPPGAA